MSIDRDTVLSSLTAADVAAHYRITGSWRGRWMRSSRCAVADHSSEAFGIAQNGMWHCWACDTGGDLLKLIALGEKLDIRHDFAAVLAVAAGIAGVEDDESFGGVERQAPKARPALVPVAPLAERVALAKKRAAWAWIRLQHPSNNPLLAPWGARGRHSVGDCYLAEERGLDPIVIRAREELRETPMRCTMEEMAKSPDLKSLAYLFASPGIALPVRHVADGGLVDIRIRRFEPRESQPKIIGMLGGVTTGPAEAGRPRQLVGCYGNPQAISARGFDGSDLTDARLAADPMAAVCEGAMDYLTSLQIWPDAWVLGAVDSGSLGLVAAHAAQRLAELGAGRLLIVEQNDGAGAAADRSVNEDPNAATKVAVRLLGPKRVGWLFCEDDGGGNPVKDLNDLHARRGADVVRNMVQWWVELP